MPLTENQKQARYNYAKAKLKRIPLDVQKDKYEQIKIAAAAAGESVNGYIKEAIDRRMESERVNPISYEDALHKAKQLKPNIDNWQEFEDAYVFSYYDDSNMIGGDSPVVILKASGRAINMVEYCDSSDAPPVTDIEPL